MQKTGFIQEFRGEKESVMHSRKNKAFSKVERENFRTHPDIKVEKYTSHKGRGK